MPFTHSPVASTPASIEKRPPGASYVTMRVLLAVVGVFGACAASYFGFSLSAEEGGISNAFDLFVTLWKIGLSLVLLVAAVGPGLDRARRVTVARWAMGAELVFDAIKLGYYHESAAVAFTIFDCLLMALVLRVGRTTRAS